MDASKHTPGTWAVVQPNDDFDCITVCAFDGDPSDGIMSDVVAEITSIEDEADAGLIAAAPAMLKALAAVTEDGAWWDLDRATRDAVEAAIAATGEPT